MNEIVFNLFKYVVIGSLCFSAVFIIIRLGSCIYHDHKALKEEKHEALTKPKKTQKRRILYKAPVGGQRKTKKGV